MEWRTYKSNTRLALPWENKCAKFGRVLFINNSFVFLNWLVKTYHLLHLRAFILKPGSLVGLDSLGPAPSCGGSHGDRARAPGQLLGFTHSQRFRTPTIKQSCWADDEEHSATAVAAGPHDQVSFLTAHFFAVIFPCHNHILGRVGVPIFTSVNASNVKRRGGRARRSWRPSWVWFVCCCFVFFRKLSKDRPLPTLLLSLSLPPFPVLV